MTKNFLKLKKDLKSFAKRVKDFKYTDKVLVVFLLTGTIYLLYKQLILQLKIK